MKLQVLCEENLTTCGYKKTSVKALCTKAQISIGTFYSLYETKEDLFFETIKGIQARLMESVLKVNQDDPSITGFAKSIKAMFREYDHKPFLYNANTPDFQALLNKLPDEAIAEIKFKGIEFLRVVIQVANLKLKVNEDQAYGILSTLLASISAKETLATTCNYLEALDFMVDQLLPTIFEEE